MERFFSYPVGCRSTSLEDLIREKWEILESNPDLQGSAKASHDDKDILLSGFITYRLFEIEGTQFLHLPRPVLTSVDETKIDPIFISYLHHLKRIGKKHLYLQSKVGIRLLNS